MYSAIFILMLCPADVKVSQLELGHQACPCPGPILLLPPVCPARCLALKPANELPADTVLYWNQIVQEAIRADRTPPPMAARNLAIVHAAIYDAVNAVERTHSPYAVSLLAAAGTSPRTAAAIAAHRTLLALYPSQTARFDAALDDSLDAFPEGPGKDAGIRLGQEVAEKLLALRQNDASASQARYQPTRRPGNWEPTPPDFRPALLPTWASVTCFCMRSGSQFRPAGPPLLDSAVYWENYREIKALGEVNSRTRTTEQKEIAYFWADEAGTSTPPGHWNQIAQSVARSRGLSLAENARLFALLNLALADAGIVSWDAKYHYQFWRPIQGIRAAPTEAAPELRGEPNWTPLLPTPPFPSYTSGHSTFSGAAAAILARFFGTDDVAFTVGSDGLPGRTRSYKSFSAAAAEAGRSRIYGGIHWEFDNADGLSCGRNLGDYISRYFLTPTTEHSRSARPTVQTAQRTR